MAKIKYKKKWIKTFKKLPKSLKITRLEDGKGDAFVVLGTDTKTGNIYVLQSGRHEKPYIYIYDEVIYVY